MSNAFSDFLSALRMREATGDYTVVNIYGFLGAYQFGEAALVDLGYVWLDDDPYDNDFSGGWTGKNGIFGTGDFLSSPDVQDAAAHEWFELVWQYCVDLGLDQYLGQTVGDILVTASGILAGAHLLGPQAVLLFLESDGTNTGTDQFGTPVSEYMALFTGYRMPFETGEVWVENNDPDGPAFILILPDDPPPSDGLVTFPVDLSEFCRLEREFEDAGLSARELPREQAEAGETGVAWALDQTMADPPLGQGEFAYVPGDEFLFT